MKKSEKKKELMRDLTKEELQAIRQGNKKTLLHLFDKLNNELEAKKKELFDFLDKKINEFNDAVTKIDDKYKGMFGMIVRELIAKMENRVYSNEIYSSASLDLILKKLYYIERDLYSKPADDGKYLRDEPSPEGEEPREFPKFLDWLKEQTDHHQSIMMDLKRKMIEKMKEMDNGEGADQSSNGEGSESSEGISGESDRTTDAKDSSSAEQGP